LGPLLANILQTLVQGMKSTPLPGASIDQKAEQNRIASIKIHFRVLCDMVVSKSL
jgi:hypothetical protein